MNERTNAPVSANTRVAEYNLEQSYYMIFLLL